MIEDEESNLLYNHGGKLVVNSRKQIDQALTDTANAGLLLNQIVVPFGKRSTITFCDGTKLWINSGSRAIYPIEFDSKIREIYVEGEVFIDVARDESKPFIVRTEKMDIKVLGTSFNISSYPDDQSVTVVLVRGSIRVKPENKREVQVSPNQALVFSKQTQELRLNNVDIYNYISWKDGWLRCESEEIGEVVNKLARYYNKKFVFDNQTLRSIHLSGKLDLKESIEGVLDVISLTAPVKFNISDDNISVSEINN
jgi:ferric-dicitrate binding protein FerR (iron transport regulator)